MKRHRRRCGRWLALSLTLAFASACGTRASDARALPVVPVTVGPAVPHAEFVPLNGGPHHGRITDFDLRGDTLDLLDGPDAEISEYRLGANGAWEFTRLAAEGTRDSIPLDFATGIARFDDGIVVIEADASIRRLSLNPGVVEAVRPTLNCIPHQPNVVTMPNGVLLISASCLDPDHVVREVLWRQESDGRFARVAADVRFSMDGSRGYLLASTHPLTETASGATFGVGTSNCLWIIDTAAAIPPNRHCGLVGLAYRAGDSATPENQVLAAFRASHRVDGFAFQWNTGLPLYLAHLQVRGATLVARRVAQDTLVLVRPNPSGPERPIFSGSVGTFLGCKRHGCLWFQRTNVANWVSAVTADSLAALLFPRPSPTPHGGS